MVYRLEFKAEGELLRVDIFGERPKEGLSQASQEAWREVARVARERQLDKLLLVSHATGDYPTLNAYQINSSLGDCGVQRGWKIAFVCLDTASFDKIKFAETVAANRGFSVGVFAEEAKARHWLQQPGLA